VTGSFEAIALRCRDFLLRPWSLGWLLTDRRMWFDDGAGAFRDDVRLPWRLAVRLWVPVTRTLAAQSRRAERSAIRADCGCLLNRHERAVLADVDCVDHGWGEAA
jgi:hypothetical protein